MKTRPLRVVLNLDLRAEVPHEPIERPALRSADVGGRDDADGHTFRVRTFEILFYEPEAVPHDERAEEVDGVGRIDLSTKLRRQGGLTMGIGEESCIVQRRLGPTAPAAHLPGTSGRTE